MIHNQIYTDEPSSEALFRYQVISQVQARRYRGESRSKAVKAVAAIFHLTCDNKPQRVSRRTIYRWLAAYESQGFMGLLPAKRNQLKDSLVLETSLVEFFVIEKKADKRASVPELIRRARIKGLIAPERRIDRGTVWRILKRKGIDAGRRKSLKTRDSRRFAYPHRMQMVLCDGKHFRAGASRLRRVAFFFLDDSSRMGLHVVVGASESAELFLRGLFEMILSYGIPDSIFVDNGSGFIAGDTVDVIRKLGILLIHGTAGYPEGHGKIERFNQTVQEQALRFYDGNPDIDPDFTALELRLSHFLRRQYNMNSHESLLKKTPWACFQSDIKPLRFADSQDQLRQAFVLHVLRRVSNDNVVSLDGISYEVIRGYAGSRIMLYRNMLDGSISMIHDGRLVRLGVVDLHKNARSKRANPRRKSKKGKNKILPKSCAQLAFENDMSPVIGPDGGYDGSEKKENK
jgi:putative transposase